MATLRYYQVEGYGADIVCDGPARYNTKFLAQKIAETVQNQDGLNLIELILGITLKGSSHLLLTEAQTRGLRSPLRLLGGRTGRRASDFESLSPVIFDVEDLAKRLSTLQPKAKKSQGDTSQANRSYIGPSSDLRNYPYRGAFEHSRLLYRILDKTVEPGRYAATNVSWKDELRIRAFSINVYPHDTRPRNERMADPKVLDIGVCDAKTSMAPIPDYSTTRHIRHPQNKTLMARNTKKDYMRNNESVTEEPVDIANTIHSIFADCQEKTASPLVLLVHDEERTLSFLKHMRVNTSDWRSGVKDLVNSGDVDRERDRGRSTNSYEQRSYEQRDYGQRGYEQHGYERRDNGRAASPRRNFGRDDSRQERYQGGSNYRSSDRDWNQGAPQKQPQRPYAPVYIIDVLKMYKTFMQTDTTTDPVNNNVVLLAKLLDIGGVDETNWWCAGDEACLLIEIWCAMASGADLDKERALNMKIGHGEEEEEEEEEEVALPGSAGPSGASMTGSSSALALNDSDDESDPNAATSTTNVQPGRGNASLPSNYDPYAEDADSDSDSD